MVLVQRILILLSLTLLVSCGKFPLNLLTGGGPSVAANVQAGKTNTQQVVASQTTVGRDLVTKTVEAQEIRQVTVNERTPPWIIGLLCLFAGFVIPSPNEISRQVSRLWRKKQ